MENLDILLINADHEEINGIDGIDREIRYVTTIKKLATLQDSIGTDTWTKEVWYIKK